jgi:hypothetical protein
MAELADAKVSKTFERKLMGVRSPLPARSIVEGLDSGCALKRAAEEGPSSELIAALYGGERDTPGDQLPEDLASLDRLGHEDGLPLAEPLLKLGLDLGAVEHGGGALAVEVF